MQNYKENQTATDDNAVFDIAIYSVIGNRKEQQDSFGYELKAEEGLITICDGMGGQEGGQIASSKSVEELLKSYLEHYPCNNISDFLEQSAIKMDNIVASITCEDGSKMYAGSTLVATVIKQKNLSWISVGDSRIYIYRKGEFLQITRDHNYKLLLDDKLNKGLITQDEYAVEMRQGEALISYIGMDGLKLIDYNKTPFPLQSEDKIILCSDGLYKLLSDEEIKRVIENFNSPEDALRALDWKAAKVAKANKKSRDNMTIALIRIK